MVFEWTVIGGGPAGIASVGKLIDAGISPSAIAWVDPNFEVGDFGTAWGYVMSNTAVKYFQKFYNACQAFNYSVSEKPNFIIDKNKLDQTCPLMIAAQPLTWITKQLLDIVHTFKDKVNEIKPHQNIWCLNLASKQKIETKKIIMAIGGDPKELSFPNIATISLKNALNHTKLLQEIKHDDYVVVFGSAQSARSVIQNLAHVKAQKLVLLYRSEDSVKRHLDNEETPHIEKLEMTPKNLLTHMPKCSKAIYAIGFNRRHIPIYGLPDSYNYNKKTGEIAPNIYGIGMAFPEVIPYELGQIEYRVTAIWPFMKRLDKLLPFWLTAD